VAGSIPFEVVGFSVDFPAALWALVSTPRNLPESEEQAAGA
jgi:hypothetical protein